MIISKSKFKIKNPLVLPLNKDDISIKPPISEKIKTGYITLKKGEEIGEHMTDDREEIIIILDGVAKITVEGENKEIKKNHLIFIPANKKHNLKNIYSQALKYIYIVAPIK